MLRCIHSGIYAFFLTQSSEAPSHSLSVTVFTVSPSLTPKSPFGGWVVVWAGAWVVRFVSHSVMQKRPKDRAFESDIARQ